MGGVKSFVSLLYEINIKTLIFLFFCCIYKDFDHKNGQFILFKNFLIKLDNKGVNS